MKTLQPSFSALFMLTIFVASTAAQNQTQALRMQGASTELITQSINSGLSANGASRGVQLSPDGRFVVFYSYATDLGPTVGAGFMHVYLFDRQSQAMELVSQNTVGEPGDWGGMHPSMSPDTRFVVFDSWSANLVNNDDNITSDVFLRDRLLGTTELISKSSEGIQGNGESEGANVSADGRFVTFNSKADNLVPGDDNGAADVFIRDRWMQTTELISQSSAGIQGNAESSGGSMSEDGRFVGFASASDNLVLGDTNGVQDCFLRDRLTGTTSHLSTDSQGVQGNLASFGGTISGNGRFVSFGSDATNLVPGDANGCRDVFVRDLQSGAIELISQTAAGVQANAFCRGGGLSQDGRFVLFYTAANNLVPDDTNGVADVFVWDRSAHSIEIVSRNNAGALGNADSVVPSISANGRVIGFTSHASNLFPQDGNLASDIFVRVRAGVFPAVPH